jgi:hypothetical protein
LPIPTHIDTLGFADTAPWLGGEMQQWQYPEHDRRTVNIAGGILISPDGHSVAEQEHSLIVISNWRSCHSFPLNTLKMGLLTKAQSISGHPLVAQRLKRLSSIAAKLKRFPQMRLSQMQDIAGSRAIVSSVAHVEDLTKLHKASRMKHKLVHEDDYIRHPKESGYRGVHLIYKYYSDRNEYFNDLKVEIQLRSLPQHIWATAVETVGTFVRQALKSSQGEEDWLRFFSLMGTAIAMREKSPLVPNTPTDKSVLRQEIIDYERRLDALNHLALYATACEAPEVVGETNAHYFLIELDPKHKRLRVTGYRSDNLQKATDDYIVAERNAITGSLGRDAVLVSVDSFKALKRAYPNYFLDTHRFIEEVKHAVR